MRTSVGSAVLVEMASEQASYGGLQSLLLKGTRFFGFILAIQLLSNRVPIRESLHFDKRIGRCGGGMLTMHGLVHLFVDIR